MVRFATWNSLPSTRLIIPCFVANKKLLKRDLLCVTDRHNLFFTAAVIAHIVNRNAFIPESSIWQIHHFDLMHFSGIRKQTDFSGIQTIYNIFILTVCRLFVSLIHSHPLFSHTRSDPSKRSLPALLLSFLQTLPPLHFQSQYGAFFHTLF